MSSLRAANDSIPPEAVARIGLRMRKLGKSKAKTDLAAGHEALRDLVSRVRKHQMEIPEERAGAEEVMPWPVRVLIGTLICVLIMAAIRILATLALCADSIRCH